jgi:type I restriction enzyme S subunit
MNDEQNINGLPGDWKEIQLGKACQKISLNGIKIKQKDYLQEGKYPVIDQGQELIGGYFNDEKLVVPNEPPYVIFGDHTKVKKFINFKFIAGADGVKVLKPSSAYEPKFFYYLLYIVDIPDKGYARHFQFLEKANIPLPPIEVQQQIVSKIEELFSELDKSIEELKTAQQQLKVYRQAVLKWAFEGKLTNESVKDGELPEGWKYSQMSEVIDQPKYGTSKKCDYKQVGKGVLRIPNIKNGKVDDLDLKYAEFDNEEINTYSLREGDILTIRSNGSVDIVGQSALITKQSTEYLYAGYLIRLRPKQSIINPRYLLHVISSSNLRNQIERKAKSTTGVNNINSDELKSLILPMCSIEEQQQIVQEIESRLSVCDKIEETITNSLKQAEALRQSILKKAFEGKLL